MSWLSADDIKYAILQRGDTMCLNAFKGVYSVDTLPSYVQPPAFYVINTDAHNLPGKHWKVLFIDEDLVGEIFDSFALPVSDQTIRFMNAHSRKWTMNRISFQHPLSSKCGAYAVYYITKRLTYSSLSEFCKTFSFNLLENERRISKFIQ